MVAQRHKKGSDKLSLPLNDVDYLLLLAKPLHTATDEPATFVVLEDCGQPSFTVYIWAKHAGGMFWYVRMRSILKYGRRAADAHPIRVTNKKITLWVVFLLVYSSRDSEGECADRIWRIKHEAPAANPIRFLWVLKLGCASSRRHGRPSWLLPTAKSQLCR